MFTSMKAVWLAAMIILLIIEALIPGLVSIWFAIGALAALVSALLGATPWLQGAIFAVVSVLTLVFTKPLIQKYVNSKVVATNADAVIGKECIVTEKIDNVLGTGAVKVDGKTWTARSCDDDCTVEKGRRATVEDISGVKLIIKPIEEEKK